MEGNRYATAKMLGMMFIGGVVLGTAAGLLFAPKSGRETRREIQDSAAKVKEEVINAAKRTKAGIEAAVEKGRAMLAETKAA